MQSGIPFARAVEIVGSVERRRDNRQIGSRTEQSARISDRRAELLVYQFGISQGRCSRGDVTPKMDRPAVSREFPSFRSLEPRSRHRFRFDDEANSTGHSMR